MQIKASFGADNELGEGAISMANTAEKGYKSTRYDSGIKTQMQTRKHTQRHTWSQRMSNHIAYALLTYTGLQIFFGMAAIKGDSPSILPYFALILLVVAVIPACRNFERRWENLANTSEPHWAGRFRKEALILWCAAFALPLAVVTIANILR